MRGDARCSGGRFSETIAGRPHPHHPAGSFSRRREKRSGSAVVLETVAQPAEETGTRSGTEGRPSALEGDAGRSKRTTGTRRGCRPLEGTLAARSGRRALERDGAGMVSQPPPRAPPSPTEVGEAARRADEGECGRIARRRGHGPAGQEGRRATSRRPVMLCAKISTPVSNRRCTLYLFQGTAGRRRQRESASG